MEVVVPKPIWSSMDVYIIGGGPSLKDFNWNLLIGKKTIGCNDAYQLGYDVCKVCIFGDAKWYQNHKESLASYKGIVYGAEPALVNKAVDPRIKLLKRYAKGICTDGVGWNGNTGFTAINLAILLGASRIFLLGFDMKRTLEDSNWHPNNLDKNPPAVYKKFIEWSKYIKQDWQNKFPHVEIVNITDDSALDIFPKVGTDEFWLRKKIA